jgi:hypothetical protein
MARDRPTRRLDEPAPGNVPPTPAPPPESPGHPFDPSFESAKPVDLASSTRRLEERQATWFTQRERWVRPPPAAPNGEPTETNSSG